MVDVHYLFEGIPQYDFGIFVFGRQRLIVAGFLKYFKHIFTPSLS